MLDLLIDQMQESRISHPGGVRLQAFLGQQESFMGQPEVCRSRFARSSVQLLPGVLLPANLLSRVLSVLESGSLYEANLRQGADDECNPPVVRPAGGDGQNEGTKLGSEHHRRASDHPLPQENFEAMPPANLASRPGAELDRVPHV